ncbi:hypothetical protein [Cystobacter ferrugineus]|uniref:Uncharacterized protein n=1 Tax=Cystobacter ferrugineus TaxID=83449 RepID=A0A1L9AUL9_9BACT|nr:hypothetical protein [Cystobacter ferrugineus]OJH33715.1 hypothetical protein BON30_47155 [Cystobacter ferrugineus]
MSGYGRELLVRFRHPFRGRVLTPEAFARIPQVSFNVALGRPGIGTAVTDRAFRASGLVSAASLPVENLSMRMSLVWNARTDGDVASACFRSLLLRTLREPAEKVPSSRRARP